MRCNELFFLLLRHRHSKFPPSLLLSPFDSEIMAEDTFSSDFYWDDVVFKVGSYFSALIDPYLTSSSYYVQVEGKVSFLQRLKRIYASRVYCQRLNASD